MSPVAVRFADRRVPGEVARDPGLGAAETYMDGRLILCAAPRRIADDRNYMFDAEARLGAVLT